MGLSRVDLLEILDLAMRLESCGEEYYRAAASRVSPGPVQRMLEALADQEINHAGRFQELLGESVASEMFNDAESEVVTKLLRKISLEELFRTDLEDLGTRLRYLTENKDRVLEQLERGETVGGVVNFSIYLEETAVLLYESLLRYVSGPVARSWLRAVLYEEKGHLSGFRTLRSQLARSPETA